MARYDEEITRNSFNGFLPPRRENARGRDPNFGPRGYYQGARMNPHGGYRAAYGWYRSHHRDDLAGYDPPDQNMLPPGREGRPRTDDRLHGDEGYLHDYNANSPALRRPPPERQPMPRRSFGRVEEVDQGRPTHPTDASRNLQRYDSGFADYVGYNRGGFAEPWLPYDPIARKRRSL